MDYEDGSPEKDYIAELKPYKGYVSFPDVKIGQKGAKGTIKALKANERITMAKINARKKRTGQLPPASVDDTVKE